VFEISFFTVIFNIIYNKIKIINNLFYLFIIYDKLGIRRKKVKEKTTGFRLCPGVI